MLELKDICFTPADSQEGASKEILKNINLTIDERFVAITGPNGSGKSTLAKIIAGIIQPSSGQILFDGVDITDFSIRREQMQGSALLFSSRSALKV